MWKKHDIKSKITFVSFRHHDISNEKISLAQFELALYCRRHEDFNYYSGLDTFILMSRSIPFFYWLLPFLYLSKWLGIGNLVYKKVAKNRKIVPDRLCNDNTCKL